jgi:hypothetical protein
MPFECSLNLNVQTRDYIDLSVILVGLNNGLIYLLILSSQRMILKYIQMKSLLIIEYETVNMRIIHEGTTRVMDIEK